MLKVYSPRFDTAGQFWPIVHNCTIFSLVFMQIIAIGIFGVKKVPFASGWIIPLPIITLLFNDYCRKRFLPIFHRYPAEVNSLSHMLVCPYLAISMNVHEFLHMQLCIPSP